MNSHRHKPGSLKQVNKKHKTSSKGKRTIKQLQGGKIAKVIHDSNISTQISKRDRMNQIKQQRTVKKYEQLLQKRCGSIQGPPRIVVLMPLTDAADTNHILNEIIRDGIVLKNKWKANDINSKGVYASFPSLKSRFLFLQPTTRDEMECLDLCQVADIILMISKENMINELIDKDGYQLISTLRGFGCAETLFLVDSDEISTLAESKNTLQKYIQKEINQSSKVFDCSQVSLLCRTISSIALKLIQWRSNRSYIVADVMDIVNDEKQKYQVKLGGYLRGKPMNIHSLIHLSDIGTFRVANIELSNDPFGRTNVEQTIVYTADPRKQDVLIMQAPHDSIDGEQTWPTEEEMVDNHANKDNRLPLLESKQIPKGMSSYQADWLVDDAGEWQEDSANSVENEESVTVLQDDDNMSIGESLLDDKSILRQVKKKSDFTVEEMELEDRQFPDEMDTPDDIEARLRFARYRALQSFRTSNWHPKENLPLEYRSIYQFENFASAQKRILDEGNRAERIQAETEIQDLLKKKSKSNGLPISSDSAMEEIEDYVEEYNDNEIDNESVVMNEFEDANNANDDTINDYIHSNQYVVITIDVDESQLSTIQQSFQNKGSLLTMFSLLQHENKLSVLHFTIQRTDNYQDVIKSKDELLFQVGFRRYFTKPCFSESNINCDKHKAERFLRHGGFSVASCYGPITFSPCPILIYKKLSTGQMVLVASGSLHSVNPDRIILKRLILTGFPIRVRKKSGVVKHMFHNPQDVLWFKPAELHTKYGLRGHITETVGTHGLFKAQFNSPIKQNDTVMLVLFKRMYPKIPEQGIIVK